MIIGFHNYKGGVGNTTLTAHTCALAKECGISVLGVSVDSKQELPRWLERAQIDCIELEPEHGHTDAELIVLDVQSHTTPPLMPDVWVMPICDRLSNENAADVSDRLRGHLIWLGNMGRQVVLPASLADQVELALPMPYSRALAQAVEDQAIMWDVPELAESAGARSLRASLLDVLRRAHRAVGKAVPPGLASTSSGVQALEAGEPGPQQMAVDHAAN